MKWNVLPPPAWLSTQISPPWASMIALQIDTWNDQRILRKKEVVYLKEIRSNLKEDLIDVRYSIDFNKRKDSAITACIGTMLHAESDLEVMTEITRNMNLLSEFSIFDQNRVAFDNMLSAENIDMISRDTLRTLLSSYYSERNLLEGTQERVKELTRKFVDHIGPLLTNKENIDLMYGVDSDLDSGNDLEFRTNRVLFSHLFEMKMIMSAHMEFLKGYEEGILTIQGQIEEFLPLED